MTLRTTAGQLLINSVLPPSARNYDRVLDKAGVDELMRTLIEKDPDNYAETAKKLSDVGRMTAYYSGGNSFDLDDLATPPDIAERLAKVRQEVKKLYADKTMSVDARNAAVVARLQEESKTLAKATTASAGKLKNNLQRQLLGAGRGNASSLNSLIGADLLYEDHRGRPIPVPVLRSYAQGLSPIEYVAGSFGARKGIVDLKIGTATAGFTAKQLAQIAHRAVVTADDDDEPYDEATPRGLPVATSDPDSVGGYLAHPVAGYKRNTEITPAVLKRLQAAGVDQVLVRSPTVGGPRDGGVYAYDVGQRERGYLAPVGDFVGLAGAQSITEPVTQSAICLARGTPVRMADWSVKAIEAIVPGDWVLGANLAGQTFPVRVLRTFDNGERDCSFFEFVPPCSRKKQIVASVVCTAEHKILSMRKYFGQKAQAENYTHRVLPIGTPAPATRFLAVRSTGFAGDAGLVSHPFARLFGVWLGDGIRVLPDAGVMVSCFDTALAESIEENIAPLGLHFHKMIGHPGQYYVGQKKDTAEHDERGQFVSGYRNPLKRLIAEWGLLGKYAHEKSLPPVVHSWNNATIAELLSGLWVTDGCVFTGPKTKNKPYLSYGSTSLTLIRQIKELLAYRFGIYTTEPLSTASGRKRLLHSLLIASELNIKRFCERIVLYGKKRETLANALAAWQIDNPRNGEFGLVRHRVTPVGPTPTHDLEVDHPDHLFVLANGLIVSNSSKHSGGVAGASAKSISGFKQFSAQIQIPEVFPGGATHAQADGRVEKIDVAPQGGQYVTVGGQRHYVPHGLGLNVKLGDTVEAGDVLSEGEINPAEIVKHKGIGEGRKFYAENMTQLLRSMNVTAHRRNNELLARSLINHVRMTEEVDDWLPDDVVPYQTVERDWRPRPGAVPMQPSSAIGRYLERPVLHYSIGTKIKPSVVKTLEKFGAKQILVHDKSPPFEPEMIRGMAQMSQDPDWMTRMLGSYNEKSLLDAAHRGLEADTEGSSFVPALALGGPFGVSGPTKGWEPRVVPDKPPAYTEPGQLP